LLILHTFEELSSSSEQLVRLLSRAKDEEDWELCKELARFLTALDESGATLREALEMVNLRSPRNERESSSFMFEGSRLKVPRPIKSPSRSMNGKSDSDNDERSSSGSRSPHTTDSSPQDYFSPQSDVVGS
jgi:RAB6A-GEF complex partner protein 1